MLIESKYHYKIYDLLRKISKEQFTYSAEVKHLLFEMFPGEPYWQKLEADQLNCEECINNDLYCDYHFMIMKAIEDANKLNSASDEH